MANARDGNCKWIENGIERRGMRKRVREKTKETKDGFGQVSSDFVCGMKAKVFLDATEVGGQRQGR